MKLRSLVAGPRGALLGVALLGSSGLWPPAARAQPAATGPDADAAKTAALLRDQALQGGIAYPLLKTLTTDYGPRLAGSQTQHAAAHWIAGQLSAMGLKNVHIESFPVPGWTRGEERAEITAPVVQSLSLTAFGGSGATPASGLDGEVALFHTYADMLAAAPGSLAGKIVVVTQPMVRAQNGSGYGALSVMRFHGAYEAEKRGAAAYLIRSLSTSDSRLPHTGQTVFPAGAPLIPAAALSTPDAEQLDRLAAAGGPPIRLHLVLTPRFVPGETGETVVADIPGRERPDQIVLISAHLDAWDLATGATDDGAGDAITAAAARLIAALPRAPRRTLRLVLYGAEEENFAGPAFAAAHAADAPHIVVASECDFGFMPPYAIALPAGAAAAPFGQALGEAVAPIPTLIDRTPARYGGDDLAALKGVPMAELEQDGTHYFDIHHSADDTLDKVDPRQMDKAVAAWAAFAYMAADTDVDFRALAQQAPQTP